MAKQGMKRPEPDRKKNDLPPVPEGEGRIIPDAAYGDNDLAIDNLMNGFDMSPTDARDFWQKW